jgi:hypothetical protein
MNIYKPRVARFVRQNRTRNLPVNSTQTNGEEGPVLDSHPITTLAIRAFPNTNLTQGLQIGAPAGSVAGPVYLKVNGTGNRFAVVNQSNDEQMTILTNGNVGINTNNPSVSLDINRNDAIRIPIGITSQRPANPQIGMMRINTELYNVPEYFNGVTWQQFSFVPIDATGGTITEPTIGGIPYRIHTYTTVGTFSFTVSSIGTSNGLVEYLVIAGGGGAGDYGAGGAGGYRCSVVGESSGGGVSAEPRLAVSLGTNTVTVGGGGLGGAGGSQQQGASSVFASITSVGGGRGGHNASNVPGGNGGSGGGSGAVSHSNTGGGSGTPGQGFAGGGNIVGSPFNGGGGGGASQAGGTATSSVAGKGGDGVFSLITGTSVPRGGGGGGGSFSATGGAGGVGGGGAGGVGSGGTGVGPGSPNTGGGGGAPSTTGASGQNGGTGIVIIRYPLTQTS